MLKVTLYTRPGCHLCDRMKGVVERMGAEIPLVLEEVDISADPELERRYGRDIPVLVANGREVARHRISPDVLRQLAARGGAHEG